MVFLNFTLRMPNQTSLSVAPKLPVSLSSGQKFQNFKKTSTSLELISDLNLPVKH